MDGFLTKPVDPAELEEMFLMLFPSEDGRAAYCRGMTHSRAGAIPSATI